VLSGITYPLSVNLNGERYISTSGGMGSPNSVANQPDALIFYIADTDIIEKLGPYVVAHPNEDVDVPVLKRWREENGFQRCTYHRKRRVG